MKPFNLQEALAGKPVVTRDGRPVKIAGYNPTAKRRVSKVVGWVDNWMMSWNVDGRRNLDINTENDLFMASEKRTYWVNVYKNSNDLFYPGSLYESESEGLKYRDLQDGYIGTYPITIEE